MAELNLPSSSPLVLVPSGKINNEWSSLKTLAHSSITLPKDRKSLRSIQTVSIRRINQLNLLVLCNSVFAKTRTKGNSSC